MELPEHLHGFAYQAVIAEQNAAFAREEAAQRGKRWAVVLGLQPVQDGSMWWLSWGGLPEGVNAFAETPEACIEAFDKAMDAAAIAPPGSPNSGNTHRG